MLLTAKDTGTKTLANANVYQLIAILMLHMEPIQTTQTRTLNGDLISITAFVSKCTPTALQASIGMKTLVSAIAPLVVAQLASTGLAINACVNVTLSLVMLDTTFLRLDANVFFIHKTATLLQTQI